MKINEKPQQIRNKNQSFTELRRISLALLSASVMTFLAQSGKAANILANPSFNSTPLFAPGSWTQHSSQTWSSGQAASADPSSVKLIHSGAGGLWMQGVYSGAPQDQYVSQTFATFPGNAYSADAFYSAYTFCTSGIGGSGAGGSGLFANDTSGNED